MKNRFNFYGRRRKPFTRSFRKIHKGVRMERPEIERGITAKEAKQLTDDQCKQTSKLLLNHIYSHIYGAINSNEYYIIIEPYRLLYPICHNTVSTTYDYLKNNGYLINMLPTGSVVTWKISW